ncbi:MAG: hypothetical protein JWM21_2889 [Acidobacteria bacterium]|nr:hypothetical protein [Acidobacteriota bacterium]
MKMKPHFFIILTLVAAPLFAFAQQKQSLGTSGLCSRDNALQTIRQQIDFTRTFDDQVRRITVLLRAADMLWPYQQDHARAGFSEAFDLAKQNFKDKGDKPIQVGHLIDSVPDQRYAVIATIAKRDAVWARKLADQMLKDETREAEEKSTKDEEQDARTAEKLLSTATSLLATDQGAALNFARSSLRYPPTFWLPMFLYKLSEINRPAADGLYQEALGAYAGAIMERFLYLSSYPFGNDEDAGQTPLMAPYAVPKDFVPNANLERLFVQALLRRAQLALENAGTTPVQGRLSDNQQIWMACTRLETQVEQRLPDLIAPLRQAKGSIFAVLNQSEQQRVDRTADREPDAFSFDHLVASAEQEKDPDFRDARLAMAVFSSAHSNRPSDPPFDQIISAIEKIRDQDLRDKLLNWAYFEQAQKATEQKNLGEARRFAAKVSELDQRAYLYLKIAEESLKSTTDDTQARELLEEVVVAAAKAPDTVVKARALLGIAYLYTKIEPSRSLGVLSDAVKSINHIDSPDFSSDDAGRRIEGKAFGAYAMMQTPGFNPENGFREIAKFDFDGTTYLAGTFANKPLRALTTLALVEDCLNGPPERPVKTKPKKKP